MTDKEHSPASANPPSINLLLEGVQVLLVDDDVDTNEIVTFMLEQSGATVTTTQSADEALQSLGQKEYDVLLSDIAMPDKDSYTLLRQLNALFPKLGKKILTIALTAHAGELNQRMALAAGFQLPISKPVEPAQLVSAIAQLIESHSPHQS